MHLNMSLTKDGVNLFADENGENGLSQEASYFIGGIMAHIQAITLITNPIVNSYKRLVTRRKPVFRIPARDAGRKRELSFEVRSICQSISRICSVPCGWIRRN